MSIDYSRFGKGWSSDAEIPSTGFFLDDAIHFDQKEGVGGASPIRNWHGPWPVLGKQEDSWEAIRDKVLRQSENDASESSSASSRAGSSSSSYRRPRMMCKSTGRCSACPKNELHRPYCQPYGNRAPIECRRVTVLEVQTKPDTLHDPVKGQTGDLSQKHSAASSSKAAPESRDSHGLLWRRQEPVISSTTYKGYQTCGRDRAQETWDYSQFVVINLLFALGGLLLLVNRQRHLSRQHRAMLARRIGRL